MPPVSRPAGPSGPQARVVIDARGSGSKAQEIRPSIVVVDADGKVIQVPNVGEARYPLSVDAILSVEDGSTVRAGDVLARIPTEGAKTRDITGGLPRVAELFEARRPKDHAIIAECDGTIRFGKDYKNKRRILIEPADGSDSIEYLIP